MTQFKLKLLTTKSANYMQQQLDQLKAVNVTQMLLSAFPANPLFKYIISTGISAILRNFKEILSFFTFFIAGKF